MEEMWSLTDRDTFGMSCNSLHRQAGRIASRELQGKIYHIYSYAR